MACLVPVLSAWKGLQWLGCEEEASAGHGSALWLLALLLLITAGGGLRAHHPPPLPLRTWKQ